MAADRSVDLNLPTGPGGENFARDVADEIADLHNRAPVWLDSVAGADTITATVIPTLVAYAKNQNYWLVPAADNTGAATININSVGAKSILSPTGAALSPGALQSGHPVQISYDGTNFRIVGAPQTIIISATEPSSPHEGMIWLVPS